MRSMFRIFAVLCFWTTSSVAQQYEYDVGGYDFNSDSFFYGTIESYGDGSVEGVIFVDNEIVIVSGAFVDYGLVHVVGDDGNFYELETE